MIVDYRKVKCDECGKEKIIKHGGLSPPGWLEINVYESHSNLSSYERLSKECCSSKCAIKLMSKIKSLPKVRFRV